MQFLFTDNLVCSVCKEALQALEERIVVAGTYFTDKLLYLKWRFNVVHAGIIRYKKLYEPFFHFFVWKAQMIDTELFIISFYSKISTLIETGMGLVDSESMLFNTWALVSSCAIRSRL